MVTYMNNLTVTAALQLVGRGMQTMNQNCIEKDDLVVVFVDDDDDNHNYNDD